MFRKKGFTLIELLVVIAIIGLLLAIIAPSLKKAKKIARDVICRANLHQWGLVFGMYTQANDDKFYKNWKNSDEGHRWIECTAPYYDNPKITLCPEASRLGPYSGRGATNFGWWNDLNDTRIGYAGMSGSYGINDWVGNPIDLKNSQQVVKDFFWASPLSKGANMAPLFLDSVWLGGFAREDNPPPDPEVMEPADVDGGGIGPGISRHCIDRHMGTINGVFVDLSVSKIHLKQLWVLKWHQDFDNSGWQDEWPAWMSGMKNYGSGGGSLAIAGGG